MYWKWKAEQSCSWQILCIDGRNEEGSLTVFRYRAVHVYTNCDSSVYCALLSTVCWRHKDHFWLYHHYLWVQAKPLIKRPLFKVTLELYSLLLCLTVQIVILRNLLNPNKVMGLNEIKVPDWAWRPVEHDSWKVLSHVWAGRSVGQEQVAACDDVWLRRGHTFERTPAKLQALGDLPQLSHHFFTPSLGTQG